MHHTPSNVQTGGIDTAQLLSRVDHDRELLLDLVEIFRKDLPRLLDALHTAIDHGDAQTAASHAHTLKGMLSNLAATQASASSARIEELAKQDQREDLAAAFTKLQTEAHRLLPELEACVAEVKS